MGFQDFSFACKILELHYQLSLLPHLALGKIRLTQAFDTKLILADWLNLMGGQKGYDTFA